MYVTTLQKYCTDEYMLTGMLAGTYSVAVVPELHGAAEASPKALLPILFTAAGMKMLVRLVHWSKARLPTSVTLVGIFMVVRLLQEAKELCPIVLTLVGIVTDVIEQESNALLSIEVMEVEMNMAPLQHSLDGLVLLTQSVVGAAVGDAVGALLVEGR